MNQKITKISRTEIKTERKIPKSGSGLPTLTYDGIGNLTLVDGPRTDVTDTVSSNMIKLAPQ